MSESQCIANETKAVANHRKTKKKKSKCDKPL